MEHGVLVLRGLGAMTVEDLVLFGSSLGVLEESSYPVPGHPMLTRFTHDAARPPTENVWHSDMSFRASPPIGTVLRSVELPAAGGDTLFADMRWVLTNLSKGVVEALEDLEAEHDIARHAPPHQRDALHARFPPICHPLIRVHPVSGHRYLFANSAYTTRVMGIDQDMSDALLRLVAGQVQIPECQCRVRWEQGTVVIWDNRHLQHYAVSDYLPQVRTMERLSLLA